MYVGISIAYVPVVYNYVLRVHALGVLVPDAVHVYQVPGTYVPGAYSCCERVSSEIGTPTMMTDWQTTLLVFK